MLCNKIIAFFRQQGLSSCIAATNILTKRVTQANILLRFLDEYMYEVKKEIKEILIILSNFSSISQLSICKPPLSIFYFKEYMYL